MEIADQNLFLWINGMAGRYSPVDTFITWVVSDYLIPVAMALALIAFWFAGQDANTRRRRQLGVFAALTSMGLSNWTVYIVNWYYFRPRPFVEFPDQVTLLFYPPTDSSFPSNAIAAASAIAIAVWWVDRRAGAAFLAAAGLYAFARVFAGVHYPLDVAAGFAIAAIATFVVFTLFRLLRPIPDAVLRVARALCLA